MKCAKLLIVVTLLVVSESNVSAESAWVLWSMYLKTEVTPTGDFSDFGVKDWQVQNAFENRRDCLKQAEQCLDSMTSFYQK